MNSPSPEAYGAITVRTPPKPTPSKQQSKRVFMFSGQFFCVQFFRQNFIVNSSKFPFSEETRLAADSEGINFPFAGDVQGRVH